MDLTAAKHLVLAGILVSAPCLAAEANDNTTHVTETELGSSEGNLVAYSGPNTLPACPAGATCKVRQVQNCAAIANKSIKFAKFIPPGSSVGTVIFLQPGGGSRSRRPKAFLETTTTASNSKTSSLPLATQC